MYLAAFYGLVVWAASYLVTRELAWQAMLLFAVTCYGMLKLNNSNALLRVRSRMVTVTFICLSMMAGTALGDYKVTLMQLCSMLTVSFLFPTYRDDDVRGLSYYAFLVAGAACLVWFPAVVLIPLLLIVMAKPLYSLKFRSFVTSMFGLLTPVWMAVPYFIYTQGWEQPWQDVAVGLTDMMVIDAQSVSLHTILCISLIALLTLMACIHFVGRSYEDKIRTRQQLWTLIILVWPFLVLALLMPACSVGFLAMAVVFASPLIAHFFTFTSSKVTNIIFIVTLVLVFVLTVCNTANVYPLLIQ